jgi:hypothetical protein
MAIKQTERQRWVARLGGYLLIPHELLHIVGFRLVGKRCEYRWGSAHVTPLEPMSRREQLVGMLFPFIVFALLFVICTILVGLIYGQGVRDGSFGLFIFGLIVMQILALYTGTTLVDLRRAYLLVFNKPWHSWTPFDIFFWPVVDWAEIRKRMASEKHDTQD